MSVDSVLLQEGDEQFGQAVSELVNITALIKAARVKVKQAARGVDPCPTRYVGVVDNYRFTTGAKGQMPTHRFEVICGNGLFLHVEATPDQFAAMMVDMTMGDITPSKVKDKLVIVERNKEEGMIPRLMIDKPMLAGVQDRWGNWLWEGATVTNLDGTLQGVIASDYVQEAEDKVIVQVDYGAGEGALGNFADQILVKL